MLEQFPTDSPPALSARYRLQSLAPANAAQSLVYEEMLACLGFLLGTSIFAVVALRSGRDWCIRRHAQGSIRLAVLVAILVCAWNLVNLLMVVAGALEITRFGSVLSFFSRFRHGWGLLGALLPIPLGFAVAYRAHQASFMDWLLKRGAAILVLALLAIGYSRLYSVVWQATVLRLSNPSLRSMVLILLPMGVMALFVPLHRRVNQIVDIHVFKRRNHANLLEWFGERLRPLTDEAAFRRVLFRNPDRGLGRQFRPGAAG